MIKTTENSRITFDLFAGCGGLTTGLENAGFNTSLVSELDPFARGSLVENRHGFLGTTTFKEVKELQIGEVTNLSENSLKNVKALIGDLIGNGNSNGKDLEVDLICGGPPCQGFSGIGHRRNYSVEKKKLPSNKLYQKMAEIIEIVKPKIYLFENVKGLLSSKWTREGSKGEIWADVLNPFRKIEGYHLRWELIQCKNYEVPQNRPRVFIIGIRDDVAMKANLDLNLGEDTAVRSGFFPMPSNKNPPNLIDLLSDLIDPEIERFLIAQNYPQPFENGSYLVDPLTSWQKDLRTTLDGKILKKGDRLTEHEYSKHKPHVIEKFLHMIKNDGEVLEKYKTKKFSQRLLPKKWKSSGPEITATSLPDDYVHFSQPRILTVREWARLQTFPDWYVFNGKRTTGGLRRAGNPQKGIFERELPKYTQIGNAVPVKLAEKIGLHLMSILKNSGF